MEARYFVRLDRRMFEAVYQQIEKAIQQETDRRQQIQLLLAKAALLCADREQQSTDDAF